MFCPNCRAEYLPGVVQCSECMIPLVNELPPEPEDKYTEVLSTYNAGDIALIKSILDDAEIEYQIEGEYFNAILLQPVKILVLQEKVEAAREVLKDFDLKYLGLSSNE